MGDDQIWSLVDLREVMAGVLRLTPDQRAETTKSGSRRLDTRVSCALHHLKLSGAVDATQPGHTRITARAALCFRVPEDHAVRSPLVLDLVHLALVLDVDTGESLRDPPVESRETMDAETAYRLGLISGGGPGAGISFRYSFCSAFDS